MTESRRLAAVDALRGLAMVIMALDHTRDFLSAEAMAFSPEDLTRTTPAIFFTRWITHLCAPVFAATAGLGIGLRLARGEPARTVARWLVARGLWLIGIELVVMRLAMNFTFDTRFPVLLIILWALGWSMIALAALVFLPRRAIGAIGLGVVLLHNLADGVRPEQFGPAAWLWSVLHQPGAFQAGGLVFVAGYPVLPWIGVMAVGVWAAGIYGWPAQRRRRVLVTAGLGALVAFVVLRLLNGYGNPVPWAPQSSAAMTVVSFLNTTKYPPSLMFVLMTLGPAALLLAWFDGRTFGARHPLVVFGRVPFAYYVVHFWLLHVIAAALLLWRYGGAAWTWIPHPLPSMGGPREMFPADLGYPLPWVYVAWVAVVVALYPAARWLAEVKARRRDWWLSYL
jgi:uncharacterized membrane protein